MVVTSRKQRDLFSKLLQLADGDMALVEAAIREGTTVAGRPADMDIVIRHIKHALQQRQTKKVA